MFPQLLAIPGHTFIRNDASLVFSQDRQTPANKSCDKNELDIHLKKRLPSISLLIVFSPMWGHGDRLLQPIRFPKTWHKLYSCQLDLSSPVLLCMHCVAIGWSVIQDLPPQKFTWNKYNTDFIFRVWLCCNRGKTEFACSSARARVLPDPEKSRSITGMFQFSRAP